MVVLLEKATELLRSRPPRHPLADDPGDGVRGGKELWD